MTDAERAAEVRPAPGQGDPSQRGTRRVRRLADFLAGGLVAVIVCSALGLTVLLNLSGSNSSRRLLNVALPPRSVHAELDEVPVGDIRRPGLAEGAWELQVIGFSDRLLWVTATLGWEEQALFGLDVESGELRAQLAPEEIWPIEVAAGKAGLGTSMALEGALAVTVLQSEPGSIRASERLCVVETGPDLFPLRVTRLHPPEGWPEDSEPRLVAASSSRLVVDWTEAPAGLSGQHGHAAPWGPPKESDRLATPDHAAQGVGYRVALDGELAAVNGFDRVWLLRHGATGWDVEAEIEPPAAVDSSGFGLVSALALRGERLAVLWTEPRSLSLYERTGAGWVVTRELACDPEGFFSGSPHPLAFIQDRLLVGAQAPGDFFDHALVVPLDGGPAARLPNPRGWLDACFGRAVTTNGTHVVSWCHGDGSIDSDNHPNCPNLTILELEE